MVIILTAHSHIGFVFSPSLSLSLPLSTLPPFISSSLACRGIGKRHKESTHLTSEFEGIRLRERKPPTNKERTDYQFTAGERNPVTDERMLNRNECEGESLSQLKVIAKVWKEGWKCSRKSKKWKLLARVKVERKRRWSDIAKMNWRAGWIEGVRRRMWWFASTIAECWRIINGRGNDSEKDTQTKTLRTATTRVFSSTSATINDEMEFD